MHPTGGRFLRALQENVEEGWNEEIKRWNVRVLTTDENGVEVIQNKAFKSKFLKPTLGNIVLKAAVELINLHEEV